MAAIFRPIYTRRDPHTGERVRKRLRKWYVEFSDPEGIRRRVRGYVDKEATRQLAARLEREAALEAVGVVDPFAEHRRRPLREHLSEYRQFLEAKGDTEKHVRLCVRRIETCLDGCTFKWIGDVDANRLAGWLADRRAAGLSARSSNAYLASVKAFTRWLQRSRRIADHPLAHLQGVNPRTDVRRRRRALSREELGRLLECTASGPVLMSLAGEDRSLLYLVASYTGLRVQELATLTVECFDLVRRPPTVTVKAGYSKHRREDVLPVHAHVASRLRAWFQERKGDALLWPGRWWERSGRMIREDLARAGVPFETTEGVADFHALRHTYLTSLARSGAHPKMIQELARHSTVTLTLDRYSHLGLLDLEAALGQLPAPPGGESPLAPAAGAAGA